MRAVRRATVVTVTPRGTKKKTAGKARGAKGGKGGKKKGGCGCGCK